MVQVVIFGGTGDLSLRKLYPALAQVTRLDKIKVDLSVVCIGRRPYTQAAWQDFLNDHQPKALSREAWQKVVGLLTYHQMDMTDADAYDGLKRVMGETGEATRLYYLATGPQFFETVVSHLSHHGLLEKAAPHHRLVIEKPFGSDLKSATLINTQLTQYLTEDQIYRMDHYLGKEMIQNIMLLRSENPIFQAIWSHHHIDHVQITLAETLGVVERAGYYDRAGAIRDMLQSHMLQMLALVASSKTCDVMDYTRLLAAKIQVLKHLRIEDVSHHVVLGQYLSSDQGRGYREEEGVSDHSLTETFVAAKIFVDTPLWQGVPCYLRTGKRLSRRVSEIVLVFKADQTLLGSQANALTIAIQPEEGMRLSINLKEPGVTDKAKARQMSFCQTCLSDYTSIEAYETLIIEAIEGRKMLFASWEEIRLSWAFIENIFSTCGHLQDTLSTYPAGGGGPKASYDLIEKDHRSWMTSL